MLSPRDLEVVTINICYYLLFRIEVMNISYISSIYTLWIHQQNHFILVCDFNVNWPSINDSLSSQIFFVNYRNCNHIKGNILDLVHH